MAQNELAERYRRIATPTIYDVLSKMGHANQALSAAIRPLGDFGRIAGPALTMSGSSVPRRDGSYGSALSYEMFRAIQPGDIIAFDTGGHRQSGPWGGNTGAGAKARGAVGIIIDGGTRDSSDLAELEFPTFARFVTP